MTIMDIEIDKSILVASFCSKLYLGKDDTEIDNDKLKELIMLTSDDIEKHTAFTIQNYGIGYLISYDLPPKEITELVETRIKNLFPEVA